MRLAYQNGRGITIPRPSSQPFSGGYFLIVSV